MTFKDRFKAFIGQRGWLKVIYVATCNNDGEPNCAPRLLIDVDEPDKIYYIDFKSSQSYANICLTQKASIAFMDEKRLSSFKINGFCETLDQGEEFEAVKAKWTKLVNAYHAERIIERVTGIISGKVGEILPGKDYVFVKFSAREVKQAEAPKMSSYPIGKIAALQLRIDDLEKVVNKHRRGEQEMKASRDTYKTSSALFEKAAMKDNLTGLYNQRGFVMLAEQQLEIAKLQKKESFFMFLDVDRLKSINDSFGHAKGNHALMDIAVILKISFRQSDIIARIGGDEFAVAMIDCGKDHLERGEARLKDNLKAYNRKTKELYRLGLSIGITACAPGGTFNLHELLSKSDQMMYEDKKMKRAAPSFSLQDSNVPDGGGSAASNGDSLKE